LERRDAHRPSGKWPLEGVQTAKNLAKNLGRELLTSHIRRRFIKYWRTKNAWLEGRRAKDFLTHHGEEDAEGVIKWGERISYRKGQGQ